MDLESSLNSLSLNKNQLSVAINFASVIEGEHTEFIINNYPNYYNIFITQYNKIGNLYQVKIDQPENGISTPDPVYTITPLLGVDNLPAEVGVRFLAEKLKIRKPLLISLSLKNYSKTVLTSIVQAVVEYKKDGVSKKDESS